jgi:two pore calcium channel protein 1
MFILLTTANFPTIMLPSYNQQRIDAWFFIIYLVVGLFLLLNLLLAIFYESYQT